MISPGRDGLGFFFVRLMADALGWRSHAFLGRVQHLTKKQFKEISMRFGRFTSMILGLAACSLLGVLPVAVSAQSTAKPSTATSSKSATAAPKGELVDINSASADHANSTAPSTARPNRTGTATRVRNRSAPMISACQPGS